MKSRTAGFYLFAVSVVQAQITTPPPVPEPVIVTNRDVFRKLEVLPPKVERSFHGQDLRGEVLECRSNVLVVRMFEMKNIYGPVPPSSLPVIGNSPGHLYEPPPMRPVIGQKKKYAAVVALRDYPEPARLAHGQEIACRVMMTGTYVWGETLIALYEVERPAMKMGP